MYTPEPAPLAYLDRLLALVAPQWALRRARARATHARLTAQLEADRRAPQRVRWVEGQRYVRVERRSGQPDRVPEWTLDP